MVVQNPSGNIIRCPEQEQHFPCTYLGHLRFHCHTTYCRACRSCGAVIIQWEKPLEEPVGIVVIYTASSCPTSGFLMPMNRNKARNMTCKYLCIPPSIGIILTMFVMQMSISTDSQPAVPGTDGPQLLPHCTHCRLHHTKAC